jgi:flagellar basal body rod protein FlgB
MLIRFRYNVKNKKKGNIVDNFSFVILLIIGLYFYISFKKAYKKLNKKTNKYSFNPISRSEKEEEIKKIIERTNTPKSLARLDERLDNLYEKLEDYREAINENQIQKTKEKIEILKESISRIETKSYKYILTIEPDITIPLKILNYYYKVITPKKFEELDYQEKQFFSKISLREIADEIFSDDEFDEKHFFQELIENELNILDLEDEETFRKQLEEFKKLRKLLENSELSEEEKRKKINNLVKKSPILQEELEIKEYLYDEPYDLIMNTIETNIEIKKLVKNNIPYQLAIALLSNGFTFEKVLKSTKKDLLKIKGIGEKKAGEILEAIKKSKI